MRDLGEAIKAGVSAAGSRQSLGPNPTFGGLTPPVLLPSLVTQLQSERLSFASVDVSQTGSAALVAAGAPKPNAAGVLVVQRTVPKYAGAADLVMEDWLESESVLAAVLGTLFASCVVAQDTAANAALAAATPAATPAADWITAIAGGQAAVVAAGGAPQLVVLPAGSWPALASELAGAAGLSTSSSEAILSVLGSRVVLSPLGAAAFVLDPKAATTVTRDVGFMVQPVASTNTIEVVADLVAGTFVSNAALAAEIAVTATP